MDLQRELHVAPLDLRRAHIRRHAQHRIRISLGNRAGWRGCQRIAQSRAGVMSCLGVSQHAHDAHDLQGKQMHKE
eukprot:1160421-Pelagomonas_calceolata.AAC.3